jgi:hypothetical protein
MKNIFVYYSAIILPFAALTYLRIADYISGWWFAGLLLSYVLMYRPIIDYWRLKSKGIIVKGYFRKVFIPSFYRKYFKALYLP